MLHPWFDAPITNVLQPRRDTSYTCVGKERLTVRCNQDGSSLSCSCERNAVLEQTFNSPSICTLGGEQLRAIVRTGCGWSQL